MKILDYCTSGGKNLITDYIDSLPAKERLHLYEIRYSIRTIGLLAFKNLNIRQLRGKLWEIKVSQTRIMYIIIDSDNVTFLHICKKQKGRAEKQELAKAVQRAKEGNYL